MNRREIGEWIRRLVPIDTLVPESGMRWRPLIEDAIAYIFQHLEIGRAHV